MNTPAFFEWIFGECETVLTESSAVSVDEPSHHVDIADAHDEAVYPFVGVVPISFSPVPTGLGNRDLRTVTTRYNDTTVNTESVLTREFSVELTPVTDDDEHTRDVLTDALTIHFAGRDESAIPSDIDDLSVGETAPTNRPESFVRANGVELTGELNTHASEEHPIADEIAFSVDVITPDNTVPVYDNGSIQQ